MTKKALVYRIIFVAISLLLYGCVGAPIEITEIKAIDLNKPKVGKIITIGTFIDNRFPFWPRKEANSPIQKGTGEKMLKDYEPLAVIKEVRIPMGEVRSQLASSLRISSRFEEIINPPVMDAGESISEMLKKSLETSDYMIVGEVNAFHVKDQGPNRKSAITLPIDIFVLGIPNIFVVLLTGGRSLLLSGGLFAVYNAECFLSMSITVYTVETGKPLATFSIQSRARSPYDAIAIYGNLNNEEDDWIDFSRRLGEIALANACNQAIDDIAQIIQKENLKKNKK